MSIKNRLKKIESGLNLNSEFCRCPREVVIKVEPYSEEDADEREPEMCQDCGKEISQTLATFNLTGNISTELNLPQYRVIEPGDELPEE